MMSNVSVAEMVPWNSESDTHPVMVSHGSVQLKHFSVSGMYCVIVSWWVGSATIGCFMMGATMFADMVVPADEAKDILLAFMPTCFAIFARVSPLCLNSVGVSVTAGADRWLLPVAVCVISTLPLCSIMFWFSSRRSRSAFILLYR